MKKFNKKLTINLPDDSLNTHENESVSIDPSSNNRYLEFKDGQESESGDNHKMQNTNFVEFQEFTVHNNKEEENELYKNKLKFHVELPDRDSKKEKWNFRGEKIETDQQIIEEDDKFKEPPAPSKGSTRNKVFIFPSTPKKHERQEENMTDLKKSFERQRQQFYKEKSKLQKQIMIKNGQIDMLQKIVKEKYSSQPENLNKRSYKYHEQSELETILLEKDLQISELLEKMSCLNEALSKKTQALNQEIIQNSSLQAIIDSLKNQLYIHEKKEENDKMTKRFYLLKQDRERYGESEWRGEEFQNSLNLGQDFGMKGLEDLQKRIQMVKMNRIEYNSRNKIKSDMSYSQTTKNKNKISFDFKGKLYDRDKKVNLNQTRMY